MEREDYGSPLEGEKTRDGLVRKLFAMFNREIFEDKVTVIFMITSKSCF